EMVRNFSDDAYDLTDPRGFDMCVRILDRVRERMVELQEATGHMYNLEATPAEGTTYRFAKEDRKRFADIIHAGTPDEPYYT
ncbi:ribonucleoside triphosphate reductase, partial [Klebsiella pneumoniae]|nr:ribonucleoside triphosphate reductase [Klebsiella pneumoniae]